MLFEDNRINEKMVVWKYIMGQQCYKDFSN